jgi:hypothetical protein
MKHSITIQFKTDKELTQDQMNNLISMIALQVQEPQDLEGNDEAWVAREISFHWTDFHAGRVFTTEEPKQ